MTEIFYIIPVALLSSPLTEISGWRITYDRHEPFVEIGIEFA
jgi:hypothetical protein